MGNLPVLEYHMISSSYHRPLDGIAAPVRVPVIRSFSVKKRESAQQSTTDHSITLPQKNPWFRTLVSIIVLITTAMLVIGGISLFLISRSHHLFSVLSGSMEPGIHTGSLIAVTPDSNQTFASGDIIAFHSSAGIITHRIVEVVSDNPLTYRTKGDANPMVDVATVETRSVIGRVTFTIPYLGYLMTWLKTKTGFSMLILLPMTLVILQELRRIRSSWHELRKHSVLSLSTASMVLLLCAFIPQTYALLSDTVIVQNNQITTATIFPTPSPTPTPSPSPTPSVSPSPSPTTTPTPTTTPCGDSEHTIIQQNSNTGNNSRNRNRATITEECETHREEETNISNDIDIDINTGNNTNGESVTSGNVDIDISINNNH